MSILDHPEAQTLLNDAILTPEAVQGCSDRLTDFLQRYLRFSIFKEPGHRPIPVLAHRLEEYRERARRHDAKRADRRKRK